MNEIIELSKKFITENDIDAVGVGVIDFAKGTYKAFELDDLEENSLSKVPKIYFDLASLSKPLTNGIGFLDKQNEISQDMKLLLNHRGGLPAWGLLPKKGWEEIIESYPIKESETLYSDYSALRFMLEFNKNLKIDLHDVASKYWHKELLFWKNLDKSHKCIQNGFRNGKANIGIVHDPNAFTIDNKVSHAGLFGTITGVCETLLTIESKFELTKLMDKDLSKSNNRFVNGWDRVEDPNNTLAGIGCSDRTFGHLGFTGTSIWIDSVKKTGHVILSNATKNYWYDKTSLNKLRRNLGKLVWEIQN
jgi:CubicO group peptidase (beta-lactamase class C family)